LTANFAIDLITALWLGFVGACIGSFLNVVAYRMPRGMSIVWKPSHCPRCSHPIRARDNVPVLGWLLLRGKCRDCGQPISARYAIVEAVMGATFFVLAYVELFSGGANLPGGPFTELAGAANLVWNPQWEILGAYTSHCLLLSLLMCVLLCNRDQEAVPKTLVIFGFVAAGALAVAFPLTHRSLLMPGTAIGAFSDCVLGALAAGVLGRLACGSISGDARYAAFNLARGSCLVGVFLGWQAIVTLIALILVVAIVRLRNKMACIRLAVDALFWLAFLQILLWGKLSNVLLH
jgi:leader peptidase (prepilin peptidase)/N-methyltransferase